jgi:hypothetical protein
VLSGIREWAARRNDEDPDAQMVKGRVAAELAAYLGTDGATKALQPVTDNQKLLPALESVLAIFLGCRAAARLIQRIIDRAIVRI